MPKKPKIKSKSKIDLVADQKLKLDNTLYRQKAKIRKMARADKDIDNGAMEVLKAFCDRETTNYVAVQLVRTREEILDRIRKNIRLRFYLERVREANESFWTEYFATLGHSGDKAAMRFMRDLNIKQSDPKNTARDKTGQDWLEEAI